MVELDILYKVEFAGDIESSPFSAGGLQTEIGTHFGGVELPFVLVNILIHIGNHLETGFP